MRTHLRPTRRFFVRLLLLLVFFFSHAARATFLYLFSLLSILLTRIIIIKNKTIQIIVEVAKHFLYNATSEGGAAAEPSNETITLGKYEYK